MKPYFFAFLLVLFISCSSSNESEVNDESAANEEIVDNGENTESNSISLVGTWQYIQRGLIYESGEEEVTDTECSNSYIFRFLEGGTFEVEIWWMEDGVCTFNQIRDGNYMRISNSDFPEANYRLRFFAIPDDDEEIGYADISFSDNDTMRIQYTLENSSIEGATHTYSDYSRQ